MASDDRVEIEELRGELSRLLSRVPSTFQSWSLATAHDFKAAHKTATGVLKNSRAKAIALRIEIARMKAYWKKQESPTPPPFPMGQTE